MCEIESERALRAGIAVLAGHGIVLAKDGLHGGEVGLEVAVGGAALGVGGVVVAVPLQPGRPVLGGTRLGWGRGGRRRIRVHGFHGMSPH